AVEIAREDPARIEAGPDGSQVSQQPRAVVQLTHGEVERADNIRAAANPARIADDVLDPVSLRRHPSVPKRGPVAIDRDRAAVGEQPDPRPGDRRGTGEVVAEHEG